LDGKKARKLVNHLLFQFPDSPFLIIFQLYYFAVVSFVYSELIVDFAAE